MTKKDWKDWIAWDRMPGPIRATTKKRTPPGRVPTGVGEASYLVRGPAALLDAMRARAKRDGLPQAEVWRRAASMYLGAK